MNLDQYTERVIDEIESYLTRVLLKIQSDSVRIIDDNKANAWGEMRRNVTYEVYNQAAKIVGVVGVRSNVPYAIFKHEGTKPHWPPQQPIQQWVIRKGLLRMSGKPFTTSKLRSSKKSVTDPLIKQIIQVSFLIARKISKKGTKGLPFLRMALNQNRNYIQSELSKLKLS
jgi:hypothetical protein